MTPFLTALIYPSQQIAAKYLYDPFGNMLAMSGPLASLNKYRFSSKEWNDNAGLYYFGRRFYDPVLQRWINRDPSGEAGGFNLYEAMGNDPVVLTDILGLNCFWNTFFNGAENNLNGIGNSLLQLAEEGDDIVGYGEASAFGYGQDFDGYSNLFQGIYNNPTAYDPEQMQNNILNETAYLEANILTLGIPSIAQGINQAATTGDYSSLQDTFAMMALGGAIFGGAEGEAAPEPEMAAAPESAGAPELSEDAALARWEDEGGSGKPDPAEAEEEDTQLGSLTPAEARQIQAFADRFDAEVNVVGSRAAGTAGALSDFDYVIAGNSRLRHSAARFLPRNPQSVTGAERGNLPFRGIDVFNGNKTPLDRTRPFIQFTPGQPPVSGPR